MAHSKNLDFLAADEWDLYLGDIAFAYNITPNRMTQHAPYDIIYGGIVKLPIDRVFDFDVEDVATKCAKEYKNPMDARLRPMRMDAEHRAYIKLMHKHRKVLQQEVINNQNQYASKMKKTYDSKRVAPTRYRVNQEVYVDHSVGKQGNERKLGINRKHAKIMDKIGANTYVVKYDDGKMEPVNVERMYTISIIDASPPIRRSHKNYLKRQKRRRESGTIQSINEHQTTRDMVRKRRGAISRKCDRRRKKQRLGSM